jgi:hypothetical protein
MIRGHTTKRWTPKTETRAKATKKSTGLVYMVDVDSTTTAAPTAYATLINTLRKAGHEVIMVTCSGPLSVVQQLLTGVGIIFDADGPEIVLLAGDPMGVARAALCKARSVDLLLDDKLEYGPAMAEAGIPTSFQWHYGASSGDINDVAKTIKKDGRMNTATKQTVRALREALSEIRDGQVLGANRKAHLSRAITHITHVASDLADDKLPSVDSVRGRKTETVDTNTPMGARSLRAELAAMKRNKQKRPPATAEEIWWEARRIKGTR